MFVQNPNDGFKPLPLSKGKQKAPQSGYITHPVKTNNFSVPLYHINVTNPSIGFIIYVQFRLLINSCALVFIGLGQSQSGHSENDIKVITVEERHPTVDDAQTKHIRFQWLLQNKCHPRYRSDMKLRTF
jgi:hypothetical protein